MDVADDVSENSDLGKIDGVSGLKTSSSSDGFRDGIFSLGSSSIDIGEILGTLVSNESLSSETISKDIVRGLFLGRWDLGERDGVS